MILRNIFIEKYFQDDMLLLRARIMNNFYFTFSINHGCGVLKTDMGRNAEFSYVLIPSTVPVNSYAHTVYNREAIELCKYTSPSNKETGARSSRKKTKDILRNLI